MAERPRKPKPIRTPQRPKKLPQKRDRALRLDRVLRVLAKLGRARLHLGGEA